MQTKRQVRQEAASGNDQDLSRPRMATNDTDFSDILDVAALRVECKALVEHNGAKKDELRGALLAILKKQLGLDLSLYTITQILSLTLFEKTPILQAFQAPLPESNQPDLFTQLILFN